MKKKTFLILDNHGEICQEVNAVDVEDADVLHACKETCAEFDYEEVEIYQKVGDYSIRPKIRKV